MTLSSSKIGVIAILDAVKEVVLEKMLVIRVVILLI